MDKEHTRTMYMHKALRRNGWQHFQRDLTKITLDLLIDVDVLTLVKELQLETVQTGISFPSVLMGNPEFTAYLFLDTHVLGSTPSPPKFLYPRRDVVVWMGELPNKQKLIGAPPQKLLVDGLQPTQRTVTKEGPPCLSWDLACSRSSSATGRRAGKALFSC